LMNERLRGRLIELLVVFLFFILSRERGNLN
jgi:hypothetical protein